MATKKEQIAKEIAKAVSAGKTVAMETVDFNDPNRPKTCLEVDFPILPVNQVAVIEGNAGKPIYQMSKWWARRRSSVFRSMLIAAATKAPEDKSHAAKLVWDNYYANHQKKGAFKHLKVAEIFMGGGTTLVEGSRLGMQMVGNDLNPVAWFVVKQELANVDLDEVKRLLADIVAEVKPQIMPYYYCDGPNGEKGQWTHVPTGKVMGSDFDPLLLTREQRPEYSYAGPEVIYTFWAKHGPCQVTGCGHRTPIMSSPVVALKTLTIKYWEHVCSKCSRDYHVEQSSARIAPGVPLQVSSEEHPFSLLDLRRGAVCPACDHAEMINFGKAKSKKVQMSLLAHPTWLVGVGKNDKDGAPLGGAAQDDVESSVRWTKVRSTQAGHIEYRGVLPQVIKVDGIDFFTESATVSGRGTYTCAACGTKQGLLDSVRASGKAAPFAAHAIQGYSPALTDGAYGGRFFASYDENFGKQEAAAALEWNSRKNGDLAPYWPTSAIPDGVTTTIKDVLPNGHGLTHWWMLFNPRQLLLLAQLLKAISDNEKYSQGTRECVLGAYQQYIRNQNMFCFWDISRDGLVPHMSNNNFYPRNNPVENNFVAGLGRGNWRASVEGVIEGIEWARNPWDSVSLAQIEKAAPQLSKLSGKSEKVFPGDPLMGADVRLASSTALDHLSDGSVDLVITDPPFGDNIQYAELSDFFYVWMRLGLKSYYPEIFGSDLTLKSLEAVTNSSREPEDPDNFYKRLLTQCWREAHRILKPGGLLSFTFHHSEDEPWVAVLESLFDAGFYLEAAYPIRSDETKGEKASFGSQKIEYDIIHVCRKRTEEPKPVSWGRMRREVMTDVRQLQSMLENHAKDGLPAADIQVIRRGKALEYFSRHYGRVYVDEGRTISVRDALIGINQLIDEDADKGKEPPPVNAEPMTRMFLRTFGNALELKRDQLQKFLKGSITTPDEFVERGWCLEKSKVFIRVNPLEFAREWSGRHKRRLTSDLDQALVLIGACFDGSGINASDTLKNENFKPHVALKPLLEWLHKNDPDQASRNAGLRAVSIYNSWAATQAVKPVQGSLFEEYEL
jgi:putative DNA methylase